MSDLDPAAPPPAAPPAAPARPHRGEFFKGRIITVNPQTLILSVGQWEGVVSHAELDELRADGHTLEVGQELPVLITNPNGQEGRLQVSVVQGFQQVDWARADHLHATGEVWEGRVTGHNRGGLIVPFGHIKAFVPASHIADLPHNLNETERVARFKALVGQQLGFKVIEVDRKNRRILLSQRNAQKEYREKQKARLLTDLAEGQLLSGKVTGLRDFGVFVDLGGADGLVHVSEISWQRVQHPAEILKLGQEVQVKVVKIDPDHSRIGLSIKRCQPDPWESVNERLQVGQVVSGLVTRVANFGAFVDVGDGVEGLLPAHQIHNKNLAERATVEVKVLRIEPERQRVGLAFIAIQAESPAEDDSSSGATEDGHEA